VARLKKPKYKLNRRHVTSTIDEPTLMHLEMLGYNIPRLIEELLENAAGKKHCPVCHREVRPIITGRKIDPNL